MCCRYRPPSVYRFLLATATLALFATTGCRDRADLPADTVRVTWSDRRVDLEVISCGLDDTVFVLAAESSTALVQILLMVEDEGEGVDIAQSAVTAEIEVGVLGAGSAELLEVASGAPGEITDARIRGDRIDVDAEARILDQPGSEVVEIEIDARCPAVEEFV